MAMAQHPGPDEWAVYDSAGTCVSGLASLPGCPGMVGEWAISPGWAIDRCPAGGKVLIGEGTFSGEGQWSCSGYWNDTEASEIRGAGKELTFLEAPCTGGTDVGYIYSLGSDSIPETNTRFTMADLSLDGMYLLAGYRKGVTVDNVEIKNAVKGIDLLYPGYYTYLGGPSETDINNCDLDNISVNGIEVTAYGYEDPITIRNTRMTGVPSTATYAAGWVPNAGIYLEGAYTVFVENTDIMDSESVGVVGNGTGLVMMEGGSVQNVDGRSVAEGAILVLVDRPTSLDIDKMLISDNIAGPAVAQRSASSGGSLTVTNSVIRNNPDSAAVYSFTSGDVNVVNNTMYGNGTVDWYGLWEVYVYANLGGVQNITNNVLEIAHEDPGGTIPRHRFCHNWPIGIADDCSNNLELPDADLDGNLVPIIGGAAHEGGNDDFAAVAGAQDHDGGARVAGCSPATIDVGAHEQQAFPPVVAACQDALVQLDASGNGSVTGADVDGGSSGGCGTLTPSVSRDTFDCDDIGDNIVVLTVTDDEGQTSTCEATLTVGDETPPIVIDVPEDVALQCGADIPGALLALCTDNCDEVSLTAPEVSDNYGTGCPADPRTIIRDYSCTDEAGNQSDIITQTVTVLDDMAPVITTCDLVWLYTGDDDDGSKYQYQVGYAADEDNCGQEPQVSASIVCTGTDGPIEVPVAHGDLVRLKSGNRCKLEEPQGGEVVHMQGPDLNLVITAVDSCGNQSQCTNSGGEDKSPPVITISEPTGRDYLDSEDLTLDFTAVDSQSGLAVMEADLDGTAVTTGQVIDLAAHDLGSHSLTVTATDNDGNSSTSTVSFLIVSSAPDVTAPDIIISSTEAYEQYLPAAGIVPVHYATADDLDPDVEVETYLDGMAYPLETIDMQALILGMHTLEIIATDYSGNVGTSTVVFYVVDDYDYDAPVIAVAAPTAGDYSCTQDITLEFSVEDPGSGIGWMEATLDGDAVTSGQVLNLAGYSLGSHTFQIVATDNTNNTSTETVVFQVVDNVAPVVAIAEPTARDYSYAEDITLAFSATDECTASPLIAAALDGIAITNGEVIDLFDYDFGAHTLEVQAQDAANTTTESVTFQVVDDVPPVVVITQPHPAEEYHYYEGETVHIEFAATDEKSAIATIEADVNGEPVVNGDVLLSPELGEGAHTLTVTATDNAGNTTTEQRVFSIDDPPAYWSTTMSGPLTPLSSQGAYFSNQTPMILLWITVMNDYPAGGETYRWIFTYPGPGGADVFNGVPLKWTYTHCGGDPGVADWVLTLGTNVLECLLDAPTGVRYILAVGVVGASAPGIWNVEVLRNGDPYNVLFDDNTAGKDYDPVLQAEEEANNVAWFDLVDGSSLTVDSVTVGSTHIAAGALDSLPHQTQVTVQLSAPVISPVAVWITGGSGYGMGTESYADQVLNLEGPAKIQAGGQTFTAGCSNPSTAAIVVTTGMDGKAVLTLTSSNKIDQTCTVHAKAGSDTSLTGSQGQSPEITFDKGDQSVTISSILTRGTTITASVVRSFAGSPLQSHDTVVYVSSVVVDGTTHDFNPYYPFALNAYAEVVFEDIRQLTDSAGEVHAQVQIKTDPDLQQVTVQSRDLQVFEQ